MGSDFSSGFQTSPTQILVMVGILVGLALLLIVPVLMGEPKRKKRPGATPILRMDLPRVRVQLSQADEATLMRIGWYVKDKAKRAHLMADHALLRKAARVALRDGTVNEQETLRLCRALGVDTSALLAKWASTSNINAGAEITVSDGVATISTGVVLLCDEQGLRIKLTKGRGPFAAGKHVDAMCLTQNGMYRFRTTVLGQQGRILMLRHTNEVQSAQRRRYRRLGMVIRAEVSYLGLQQPPLVAKTIDLSGGGAAMSNPKKRFDPSAQLTCTLYPPKGKPVTVNATVLRTSRRNKIMHLRFFGMDDAQRHDLFALLYQVGA